MSHPVITFPQPPPTSNTLTSHQRQQLLRSTRKLTKLLGSAPHLVDRDRPPPVYLDLSSELQSISRTPSHPSHEFPRPPSPTSSISSVSTTASRAHHKPHFSPRSENQDSLEPSFAKKRPPMLRLASLGEDFSQSIWAKTKLDIVPGSPPAMGDTHSSHSSSVSDASYGGSTDHLLIQSVSPPTLSTSRSYTLPVPRRRTVPSPFVETSEPAFKVTSEAAARRLKMERIRKLLGECVPVEAVFPHEFPDGEDGDGDGDYVEVVAGKEPAQVNIDVSPRWRSSSAVVAFDVVYECPGEHGDEGLANGLSFASRPPKRPISKTPRSSNSAPPRQSGKLSKRSRKGPRF